MTTNKCVLSTKVKATVSEIIEGKVTSPLPLDVIPNHMGINLCAVDSMEWERREDGQLINLTISFTPENKEVEPRVSEPVHIVAEDMTEPFRVEAHVVDRASIRGIMSKKKAEALLANFASKQVCPEISLVFYFNDGETQIWPASRIDGIVIKPVN